MRELVDAWNSHETSSAFCAFFDEDFENWQAPLPTVHDLDAYRAHLSHWSALTGTCGSAIVTLFADGDRGLPGDERHGSPAGVTFFAAEPTATDACNRALDVLELRDGRCGASAAMDFSLPQARPHRPRSVRRDGGERWTA